MHTRTHTHTQQERANHSSLSLPDKLLLLGGAPESCSPAKLHTSVPASVCPIGAAASAAAACSCSAIAEPTARDMPVPGRLPATLLVLLPCACAAAAAAAGGVLKLLRPASVLNAGESHRLFSMSYRSTAALASAVIKPACSFQYSTAFLSLQGGLQQQRTNRPQQRQLSAEPQGLVIAVPAQLYAHLQALSLSCSCCVCACVLVKALPAAWEARGRLLPRSG